MSQSNTSATPFQERPTDDRPDISVIIVSWNVRDLLLNCLDSLLSPGVVEDLRLEVLVIDNASMDGS